MLSAPKAGDGGWHTDREVPVDVAVADDVPGEMEIETVAEGPTDEARSAGESTRAIRDETVVLSGDGTHDVAVIARDAAGNASAEEGIEVRIDSTAPEVAATSDDEARTVEITAEDATSGVAEIQYRVNGGAWRTYDDTVRIGPDAADVDARAVDVAGNVSTGASASVSPEDGAGGPGGDGGDGGDGGGDDAAPGGDGALPVTGGGVAWWIAAVAVLLMLLGGTVLVRKRGVGRR